MNFTDMKLEPCFKEQEVVINSDIKLAVRDYLPMEEKAQFIQYIVNASVDNTTGCFSPLRVELYFNLALCHWYARIDFGDGLFDAGKTYDALDTNGVIAKISNAINPDELKYIRQLTEETVTDIARYNNSAAGIIQMMSSDTEGLTDQVNTIVQQIRDNSSSDQLKQLFGNMVGSN